MFDVLPPIPLNKKLDKTAHLIIKPAKNQSDIDGRPANSLLAIETTAHGSLIQTRQQMSLL